MSLDWNITAVKGHKDLCYIAPDPAKPDDVILHPRTQCLIFDCIVTGIGTITERNWFEFYARRELFSRMIDLKVADYSIGDMDHRITPHDVLLHVGLSTNVFPEESRLQWLKRHGMNQLADLVRFAKVDASNPHKYPIQSGEDLTPVKS